MVAGIGPPAQGECTLSETEVASEDFRAVLSRFASGVTVITTQTEDGPSGMTVSAFSSVSLDPPLVLACIARTAQSFADFQSCQAFGVSILAEGQVDIAKTFATRDADKFASATIIAGPDTGVPLIAGAIGHLECVLYDRHAAGDHIIMVGEVTAATVFAGKALLHGDRQFGTMQAS